MVYTHFDTPSPRKDVAVAIRLQPETSGDFFRIIKSPRRNPKEYRPPLEVPWGNPGTNDPPQPPAHYPVAGGAACVACSLRAAALLLHPHPPPPRFNTRTSEGPIFPLSRKY
eukprot:1362652-Amorphochlora_amoeboformis.AAC.1